MLHQFMRTMSRFNKIVTAAAIVMAAVSCGRTAKIDAVVADAASSEVVVKLLDINKFETLDTVALDETGRFSVKVDAVKGQPEFVYIFHNDRKIVSLVLQGGDKVSVEADTLGNYTVSGSDESLKLAEVEHAYAEAVAKMNEIAIKMETVSDVSALLELRQELGQEYVSYYRDRLKYVMANARSISVVPVLYQTFGANLPVFGQSTDAIYFRNIADSLALSYPESKYVKALRQEADRRFGYLQLETRIRTAEEIGYPDVELPDIKGENRKLSSLDSKAVLVFFWSASDAGQKMFNMDILKSIYDDFHGKGLEIYQVALDADKGLWAKVVKEQNLPWVNVCDARAAASPYASLYNVSSLPAMYVIHDGELKGGKIEDVKTLRKLLRGLLK